MSENKDNKLTLINEKTANDYLTHTTQDTTLTRQVKYAILSLAGSNLFSLRRADAAPEEKVDFS